MVIVCCCQCDPRLAAYGVSILSFLHFLLESVLLYMLDDEHRLVADDSGIKFLTVFGTNLFLVVSSVLLFFGVFYLMRWLCLPWLIGCSFHLLIYLAILVIIFIRLISDPSIVETEKFLFTLFQMGTVIYAMWIIASFMLELSAEESSRPARARSVFKLYSEPETDVEGHDDSFFSRQKKNRHSNKGIAADKEPLLR